MKNLTLHNETGRLVCWPCRDDLTCVRIGVFHCRHCGHTGPIDQVRFCVLSIKQNSPGVDFTTRELFEVGHITFAAIGDAP